jgi:hypothetical protein
MAYRAEKINMLSFHISKSGNVQDRIVTQFRAEQYQSPETLFRFGREDHGIFNLKFRPAGRT